MDEYVVVYGVNESGERGGKILTGLARCSKTGWLSIKLSEKN